MRFLGFILGVFLTFPAWAGDWGTISIISSTLGVHGSRICIGEATRGDVGCPTYAPSLTTAGDVSVTRNLSAAKFFGDGSGLTGLSAGAATLASLTDVSATGAASGMLLRYNGSKWESVGASAALSTTTMAPNFPDAIICARDNTNSTFQDVFLLSTIIGVPTNVVFYAGGGTNIQFVYPSGAYSGGGATSGPYPCNLSLSQLYAQGRAFNFIGGGSSSALGDRMTSGTTTAVVNSATTYISLTTGTTTWGYISSGTSYLPTLAGVKVSSTNASFTALTVGGVNISGSIGTYSCPPTFMLVQHAGQTLGCISTNQESPAATWSGAANACYTNYGGRLPSTAESYIAKNNYTLVNETGAWEWTDDTAISSQHVVIGATTIDGTSYSPDTNTYFYRCFIPASGQMASAAGPDKGLQYNNNGVLAADANLAWISATQVISATNASLTALTVGGGGVGVGYEIITNVCPGAASCTATCSAGKQATGGGCQGQGSWVMIYASPGATSYGCASNPAPITSLVAYAYCSRLK